MKNFKDTLMWKIVKNKYFIVCFVFLLIILFLDENNIMVVRSLKRDVSELEYIIDTMHRGIRQDSIQAERLKYDLDSIERYGREVYFMKRDDEDVFVIKEEDEK